MASLLGNGPATGGFTGLPGPTYGLADRFRIFAPPGRQTAPLGAAIPGGSTQLLAPVTQTSLPASDPYSIPGPWTKTSPETATPVPSSRPNASAPPIGPGGVAGLSPIFAPGGAMTLSAYGIPPAPLQNPNIFTPSGTSEQPEAPTPSPAPASLSFSSYNPRSSANPAADILKLSRPPMPSGLRAGNRGVFTPYAATERNQNLPGLPTEARPPSLFNPAPVRPAPIGRQGGRNPQRGFFQ